MCWIGLIFKIEEIIPYFYYYIYWIKMYNKHYYKMSHEPINITDKNYYKI
jgi:hypothetical protein